MIYFFGATSSKIFALETPKKLEDAHIEKLIWLFDQSPLIKQQTINQTFIGPRATMITPWSTNAVEICQNMGVKGIRRIESFQSSDDISDFDPMLKQKFEILNQSIFEVNIIPEPILYVEEIKAFNEKEGLAMNEEEIVYLNKLAIKLERSLTDSEVFGFSQVNSEHCRHKIFNGTFVLDDKEMPQSLFKLIKKTSKENPNTIISAYKDNVAFIKGPEIEQFAPQEAHVPSAYEKTNVQSVISIKAETHNFPTTIEPFNGAATGSGGEIRDRMAGGRGSIPLAGTAVYMTPYSRVNKNRKWENKFAARPWRYQTPLDILIKASNGASDFGNKFGQPLINGSLFTFEHHEGKMKWGYDKVIMLAGGVGMGIHKQAIKQKPKKGDLIVILGGDNYRIGMGGAAVSSANTGSFNNTIELNAVQRSNPEMQKRVANTIRALVESTSNPIISIHDHGAGGHLNCLSELVEENGGEVAIDKLPIGDPTLSAKEIVGNESQERMGLIIDPKHRSLLESIANRERAPIYFVGTVAENKQFTFVDNSNDTKPIDLHLDALFGSAPKTIIKDNSVLYDFDPIPFFKNQLTEDLKSVLQLEAVGCKDWLTNKVDRCVTGRVAQQQTVGPLQLPLSNCGVIALDFKGKKGIATAIGHAPLSSMIDPKKGSINAIAESLTNLIWAPLTRGLQSVSLSANWMWPCNNPGEDVRLYKAVEACANFAIALGINIPTGKDSLSMKQQYSESTVTAPGTVVISAVGECLDVKKVITPEIKKCGGDIYYINLSQENYSIGGSSFGQIHNKIGNDTASIKDAGYFKKVFNLIQNKIISGSINAGHDVSSGGLITTLLEMCFPQKNIGMNLDLTPLGEVDSNILLFSENSGIVIQAKSALDVALKKEGVKCIRIGEVVGNESLILKNNSTEFSFNIPSLRDVWYSTSTALDEYQTSNNLAKSRFDNYKNQELSYVFPNGFLGKEPAMMGQNKIKAAIIREQGSNSEREMAYAMQLAGFEVIDVHMTDLIEGRETLEDIKFIAAVGGFSNSDVLGSAKGWAGSFLYNEKAKVSLENFFKREDTLSLGVCNGCQLFVTLEMITPDHQKKPKMLHNESGKFECHFTAVTVQPSSSILMKELEGSTLGIWAAHGEGKFNFPMNEDQYQIPAKYHFEDYPANPNGSDFNAAMLSSENGRHLVMMPHLERSTFPWNWGYYPQDRKDEVSPWIVAFESAHKWLSK